MYQRVPKPPQPSPLAPPLITYLHDTVRREERRRRRLRGAKLALLLVASLFACQWPFLASDAADTVGAARRAGQAAGKVATFACPQLGALLAEERIAPAASLQRLAFAGAILSIKHDAL